jgi:putative DNA primase/helicase
MSDAFDDMVERFAAERRPRTAARNNVGEALVSAGVAQNKGHRLISRCAGDIEPKRIDFIWPGRIARGKHTAIAGQPGDGKSQLSIFISATVSRGGEWPCGEGTAPLGNVVILSAEDSAADTIVPRLIAAGADRNRVHLINAVQEGEKGRRSFNLQSDLALLEEKIREIGDVALVIIDPISSYMGKADSHKNSEVRGVLEPASEMAERLDVAILSITHFSKSGSGNTTKALDRFIGSIAFVGAPRAAFAVIQDADNDGRILLLHAKNNMAPKPQGLAYRPMQTIVGEPGQGIVAAYVLFDTEPVRMSADEALRATDGGGEKAAATEAEEFLREKLSQGPVQAKEGEDDARALGITPRTLKRARKKLGVIAEKVDFKRAGRGGFLPKSAKRPRRVPTKLMALFGPLWHPSALRLLELQPPRVLISAPRTARANLETGNRYLCRGRP